MKVRVIVEFEEDHPQGDWHPADVADVVASRYADRRLLLVNPVMSNQTLRVSAVPVDPDAEVALAPEANSEPPS